MKDRQGQLTVESKVGKYTSVHEDLLVDDEKSMRTILREFLREAGHLEYQERLEQLVQERTRELEASNLKLQQALEELTKAQSHMIRNERMNALGQMAMGIAHDFNNALMPIIGHSEYFLTKPEALDNKRELGNALKDIYTAAENAREIVHRLRELYRPQGEVHSAPGEGATFHLRPPSCVHGAAEKNPVAGAPTISRSLSILVVDDRGGRRDVTHE